MSRDAQTWFRKLRVGLNPVEKLIGGELAYRAEDDTHHAWPTQRRIADDTEVPVRTVTRVLAALEDKGIITRVGMKEATNAVIWRMNVEVEINAKLADPLRQIGEPPYANLANPPLAKLADTKLTIESNSRVEASQPRQQKNSLPMVGHDAVKNDLRGKRLTEDWIPSDECHDFAVSLGLHPGRTLAKFRDYWLAKPGKDAVKLDWNKTWRNWCRSESERRGTVPPPAGPRKTTPTYGSGY